MPTLPQISRNGTSVEELLRQQRDVLDAARALRGALLIAHPNLRDYQYRPAEGQAAITESNDRIAAVDATLSQTMELVTFLRTKSPVYQMPRARVVIDETTASGIRIVPITDEV